MLEENYYWAWKRLNKRLTREEVDTPADIADSELVEIMIDAVIPKYPSKGDGRFNRVVTYITNVCDTLEWLKRNWSGKDDILSAFMLGMEVSCQALRKEIKLIDQKPFGWPETDWRNE